MLDNKIMLLSQVVILSILAVEPEDVGGVGGSIVESITT